ncbi:MAG: leucyl aminopeptidase [Nitrospiraceae bacterium]|nr:leucyl aminopeptidase [Nitrospiraceae bacterium]
MDVRVKQGRIEQEPVEVLVLSHYEDGSALTEEASAVNRALHGALDDLLKSGEFQGKCHQTALLHTQGNLPAKRVLLVGLGKQKEARLDTVRQAMGTAIKRVRQIGARSFATPLHGRTVHDSAMELAQAMTEGAILGGYRFTVYRSHNHDEPNDIERMTVLQPKADAVTAVKEGVRRGVAGAEAAMFVRDLCNHPSNVMTPSRIADEAKKIGREPGIHVKILEQRDVAKLGMGAFLGVARGSHEPPKFIIVEYRGRSGNLRSNGRGRQPLVLVGKTITFDTGGISLKSAENMEQMKADMTGGAEVLAAIRAASRLRLPLHIIGLLPATENMPGGGAIKPGDILTTMSGQTVEVQNTDAEGRLILADGLHYATRYKPAAIIDIATLTGACMVALGQFAVGMLGNNEDLKRRVQQAGLKAGERVWEMPLWDEYFEQLRSDVADMRNIGGRGGGMITAAVFLSKFVGDCPWVHLDIASTDWSERERAYISKGPTGIGTRLLIQFLIDHAENPRSWS